MCGRYTYAMTNWPKVWKDFLGGAVPQPAERTWNVAPTRKVPVVRMHPATGEREFTQLVWGLVPSWAKDFSVGSAMINARGETVAEKPAYRSAFRKRRCLMLTTGFYEWEAAGTRQSRPWFIRHTGQEVFAFAAIWESWEDKAHPAIGVIETCAIITIHANTTMARIHDRMPVILDPADYAAWLDPARQDPADLLSFVKPCPPEWLAIHPVSRKVNNARNNGPELIAPDETPAGPEQLQFPGA